METIDELIHKLTHKPQLFGWKLISESENNDMWIFHRGDDTLIIAKYQEVVDESDPYYDEPYTFSRTDTWYNIVINPQTNHPHIYYIDEYQSTSTELTELAKQLKGTK